MTWTSLLANKEAQKHKTSKKELDNMRALIARDFTDAFKDVDVVLTPSTPSAAFGADEKNDDPIAMYLNDVFTVTVNLAGLPGISVPAGLSSQGLPLGLQLIGRVRWQTWRASERS